MNLCRLSHVMISECRRSEVALCMKILSLDYSIIKYHNIKFLQNLYLFFKVYLFYPDYKKYQYTGSRSYKENHSHRQIKG